MTQGVFLFTGGSVDGKKRDVPVDADGRPERFTMVTVSGGRREIYARTVSTVDGTFGFTYQRAERFAQGAGWVQAQDHTPTKRKAAPRGATAGRTRSRS